MLQLGWIRGEEGNLLMAEPLLTSRDERERLTHLMFEGFNVSSYFASDQAVLSLFSMGKLSGIVVDMGYDKTGPWGKAVGGVCVGRGVDCEEF